MALASAALCRQLLHGLHLIGRQPKPARSACLYVISEPLGGEVNNLSCDPNTSPQATGDIMIAEHGAAKYHVAAAFHHQQAMGYHRDAARQSMTRKSHACSRQQASLAYAHASRAADDGNSAHRYYARYDHHGLPNFPEFMSCWTAEPTGTPWNAGNDGENAEHHFAAARHHEHAAQYHRKASLHCADGDYVLAIHAAKVAHSHARQALFYADMGTGRFGKRRAESQDRSQSAGMAEWMDGSDMMSGLFGMRKMTRKLGCALAVLQS